MENETRVFALSKARDYAVAYAHKAERQKTQRWAADDVLPELIDMANMWANVANALKTGSFEADK